MTGQRVWITFWRFIPLQSVQFPKTPVCAQVARQHSAFSVYEVLLWPCLLPCWLICLCGALEVMQQLWFCFHAAQELVPFPLCCCRRAWCSSPASQQADGNFCLPWILKVDCIYTYFTAWIWKYIFQRVWRISPLKPSWNRYPKQKG